MQIGTTLTRFIIEEERQHPEATGEFTGLLTDLASAAKIISRDVNKAGLAEVMGITGRKMEILDELSGIAPTSIVRGNVDTEAWAASLPYNTVVDLSGHQLYIVHDIAG